MEPSNLKSLLDKYLEGQTSLAEEQQLAAYFKQADVDPAFAAYKPLFSFFDVERETKYPNTATQFASKNKPKRLWLLGGSIAAALAIIFSVYLGQQAFTDDRLAYEPKQINQKEALQNTKALLSMMTNVVDDSKKQLGFLQQLQETKNEIIKSK